MVNQKKYVFDDEKDGGINKLNKPASSHMNDSRNKLLKKELIGVFRQFGYLGEGKDYEVTFKTTSGSIAWINISSIEIIK